MAKRYALIDVRTPEEFKEESIKGSINIPLDNIPNQIDDIQEMDCETIILYCHLGGRSEQALQIIKSAYPNINAVNIGGFQDAQEFVKKVNHQIG